MWRKQAHFHIPQHSPNEPPVSPAKIYWPLGAPNDMSPPNLSFGKRQQHYSVSALHVTLAAFLRLQRSRLSWKFADACKQGMYRRTLHAKHSQTPVRKQSRLAAVTIRCSRRLPAESGGGEGRPARQRPGRPRPARPPRPNKDDVDVAPRPPLNIDH